MSWLAQKPVPKRKRHADGTTRVAGRRLNPDFLERPLTQDAAVGDAIERDTAGKTQVSQTGLAMGEPRHLEHHLFGDVLN